MISYDTKETNVRETEADRGREGRKRTKADLSMKSKEYLLSVIIITWY